MKFEEWLNTLDLANLNDLQPNEGMEMGWYKCKKEVLALLNHSDCYKDRKYVAVPNHIIEEIEKL